MLKKYTGRDSERQRFLFPHMSGNRTTVEEEIIDDPEQLSPEEERVMRMRAGASLGGEARLESKLDGVAPEHHEKLISQLEAIQRQALKVIEGRENVEKKKDKIVLRLLKKEQ